MNHLNNEFENLWMSQALFDWDDNLTRSEPNTDGIISVLGEHYEELKEFYLNIIMNHENYDYITFVVRRSLLLAEVFYSIFWMEGEEHLRHNLIEARKKFRTDNSILMLCEEDVMPSVLLVDELMLQGDSINKLLQEMGSIFLESHEKSETKSNFLEKINISVFCRSVNTMVITDCLYENFYVARWMEDKEWHDFSNRVGILIQDFCFINAAFTLGVSIPPTMATALSGDVVDFHKVETESKDLKEVVYFYDKLTFATIRSIYHKAVNRYTLIPFLFLPDISDDVFLKVSDRINEYLLPAPIRCKVLSQSRYVYELTMLFLSATLLEIFCADSVTRNFSEFKLNVFGILTNFGLSHHESMAIEFLSKIRKPSTYWSEEQFVTTMCALTSRSQHIMPTESVMHPTAIGSYLEDYVYARKIEELEEIDRKSKGFFYGESKRSETLMDCLNNLSETSNEIFAWLLQLMDRGIISLKIGKEENHVKQILRAGEASLFIRPKRYEQFLPLFAMYSSRMHRVNMEDVVSGSVKQLRERGRTISDTLEEELNEFISQLIRSDQDFNGWNIPLFSYGFDYSK